MPSNCLIFSTHATSQKLCNYKMHINPIFCLFFFCRIWRKITKNNPFFQIIFYLMQRIILRYIVLQVDSSMKIFSEMILQNVLLGRNYERYFAIEGLEEYFPLAGCLTRNYWWGGCKVNEECEQAGGNSCWRFTRMLMQPGSPGIPLMYHLK